MELEVKRDRLKEILISYKKIAIAFSGGVDSSFLLFFAKKYLGEENVLPITLNMSMHTERERRETIELAKGLKHVFVDANEYENEKFVENGSERCYHCKRAIFEKIIEEAEKHGFKIVCDGTNYDDLDDYRPGIRALRELDIKSPLKDAMLTKEEIRKLSKEYDIVTWNKPSKACLASRIPYGTPITREAIKTIENCEDYLIDLGIENSRVRHHGDIARIEVPPSDMEIVIMHREDIVNYFKSKGFKFVTLDLYGYKMGSLNSLI